jgi:uncharacterized membrane protein YagU involved in acid resistance
MNTQITNTIKGGLFATAAMTMLMVLAPMMGMPKMPIGNMLAGFMHMPVVLGWIAHFVIGTMLAAGYVFIFKPMVGGGVLKGVLFSLIPFFMAQLVVMPMMGAGLFSSHTPAPLMMVMGSLIGHLVYGIVLGLIVQDSKGIASA